MASAWREMRFEFHQSCGVFNSSVLARPCGSRKAEDLIDFKESSLRVLPKRQRPRHPSNRENIIKLGVEVYVSTYTGDLTSAVTSYA